MPSIRTTRWINRRSFRNNLNFRPALERAEDRFAPATLSFQQGVAGYADTTDTDLFSLDPNTNFADNTFISVDQQDFDNVHHGLLRFGNIFTNNPTLEPTKIPFGSTINSASLSLSNINESNLAALLSLYRMKIDWAESTSTWNSFGPLGGIQTDGVEAERNPDFILEDTATQGTKICDVKHSLQAWADGVANHGWAVIQYSSNGWDFETSEAASKQPLLTVDFTPPTPGGNGNLTLIDTSFTAVEGDSGSSNVTVQVARRGGFTGIVTVDYTVTPGSATDLSDYDSTGLSGKLTFNPTDTVLPINIPILGDNKIEGTEKFTVTLTTAGGGATLGATTVADVVIADQDVLINEVFANVSGAADDGYEYIELRGTPNASLNGLQVVIFEGETEEAGGGVGVADLVVDLTGQTLGSNGLLVLKPTAWKYSPAVGTNTMTVTALDKVGGGIEDSSLTVALIKGVATLTVGTDYDLDTGTSIKVGRIDATDPLFGADLLDSVGWTEMGGSDADRQITYNQPGVRLNQPQAQIPADSGGTASDGGSRFVSSSLPNTISAWFNGDVKAPAVPVAYDLPPRAYVNNPAGAQMTPGDANVQKVITFLVSSYKVQEVTGTITVTVDRLGDTTGTSTVQYSTVDGTAKSGSDYGKVTGGIITFDPGEGSDTFSLTVSNDGIPEGFESFSVKLSSASSPYLIATSTATIRIEDADAKVADFQNGDLGGDYKGTLDAGIYGWQPGSPFGFDLTVAVDQADANLITDPQRPDQGLLRFDNLFGSLPGQVPIGAKILNGFVTFNVVNPSEATAQIRLFRMHHDWNSTATWTNPTLTAGINDGVTPNGLEAEATPDAVVPTPNVSGFVEVPLSIDTLQAWANGTSPNYGWSIVNDSDNDWQFVSSEGIGSANRPKLTLIYIDPAGDGEIAFSEPSFEVNENAGTATLTVHRIAGTTNTLTVNVAITGGNATGADYGVPTASLVFGPTDKSKSITLPITNDGKLEANETVQFTLTGAGVTFSRDKATLVIRDNDYITDGGLVRINEFETNSIGQDQPWEYVEFSGTAGSGLGGLYFLAIEGDNNQYLGGSDFVADLSANSLGTNGLALVKAFNGGHATPDPNTTLIFNGLFDTTNTNALRGFDSDHTNSYLLIYSPTATFNEYFDFDWNNDGTLELPSDAIIIDAVGQNDGGGGDIVYGGVSLPLPLDVNGQPIWVPDQVSRFRGNTTASSVSAWFYGDHLGTDDALVYDTAKSTGLPISGAAANPGQINVAATTPLVSLTSVTIDTGTAQRSMVRSLTLNFNGVADRLLTDGLQFTTDKDAPVAGVNLNIAGVNSNTWTITFSGSPIIGNSLPDGRYKLTVNGINIVADGRTVDANNVGTPGTTRVVDFHRLFGDVNGDAAVAGNDFNVFKTSFGGTDFFFDYDGDGFVGNSDFNQFKSRFGGSLP